MRHGRQKDTTFPLLLFGLVGMVVFFFYCLYVSEIVLGPVIANTPFHLSGCKYPLFLSTASSLKSLRK